MEQIFTKWKDPYKDDELITEGDISPLLAEFAEFAMSFVGKKWGQLTDENIANLTCVSVGSIGRKRRSLSPEEIVVHKLRVGQEKAWRENRAKEARAKANYEALIAAGAPEALARSTTGYKGV